MRDPLEETGIPRDCLDVKFAGHFPRDFFSNNHVSGESCYLSGKQFLEPK